MWSRLNSNTDSEVGCYRAWNNGGGIFLKAVNVVLGSTESDDVVVDRGHDERTRQWTFEPLEQ